MADASYVVKVIAFAIAIFVVSPAQAGNADRAPTCLKDDQCVARLLATTLTTERHQLVLRDLIEFEPGRVRVYSAGREKIQALVAQWKRHREWRTITVDGYAPRSRVPQSLAQRRAERIRDYLVRYGVPADQIATMGHDDGTARMVDLTIDVCSAADCQRKD